MSTFLQIVGVGALVIIAILLIVVVGGFLFIRSKLRGLAKQVEGWQAEFGDHDWSALPARIQVRPKSSVTWANAEAAEAAAEKFTAAGFSSVGYFEVAEIPGLTLRGFVKPDKSAMAAIYERAPIGPWVDCIQIGPGDSGLTVTNTPHGDDLDRRPGQEKYYLPDQSIDDVITRFNQETQYRTGDPISPEDFASRMELSYAREMDWRNSRGGATEEEIRRLAIKRGPLNDEIIIQTAEVKRMHACEGLKVALLERYLAATPLSAVEWEEQRHRIVFVHDVLLAHHVAAMLYPCDDSTEEEDEDSPEVSLDNSTARREFAKHNDALPKSKQALKISELHEPLGADVYLLKWDYNSD